MTQFNHEQRIALLEKENEILKTQIADIKKQIAPKDWITIRQASVRFDLGYKVIKGAIDSGKLIHKRDWKRNGNRYLINAKTIQKIQ